MISIHKYLHLDLSVVNVGRIIINLLKEKGVIKYDELFRRVALLTKERIEDTECVFIPALSFLYLLGKINYKQDNNIIEYLK